MEWQLLEFIRLSNNCSLRNIGTYAAQNLIKLRICINIFNAD